LFDAREKGALVSQKNEQKKVVGQIQRTSKREADYNSGKCGGGVRGGVRLPR